MLIKHSLEKKAKGAMGKERESKLQLFVIQEVRITYLDQKLRVTVWEGIQKKKQCFSSLLFISCILDFKSHCAKRMNGFFFFKVRKEPRCEFQISSQGLIKKGIVRKLMKAINSASGRAAGGDFPSKIGTSLDVPLSIASSRAPSFYKKRKVNCSLVLGRNMRVRLS